MRYNVTARCDTPNHFSISSRCLTRCIDFYRPSSLPSRLFISSVSTDKCNIPCLHSLPAKGKAGKAFSEKNALTDQYLEQREPSQAEVGTVLAIDDDWHFAALEKTLKQKPPATTNMICCQSQQRANRPAVWEKP
jgi:hypothetical protein